MQGFLSLKGKERHTFQQSKYEYYETFNKRCIIITDIGGALYFAFDCALLGRLSYETMLFRLLGLVPLLLFLFVQRRTSDHRIMAVVTFFTIQCMLLATYASMSVPELSANASESVCITNAVIYAVAYSFPFWYAEAFHLMFLLSIPIADQFVHFTDLKALMLLNFPCFMAVTAINYYMNVVYLDHYRTQNTLEATLVTDNLTKAFNRRQLDRIAKDGKLKQACDNVSVLMLDIDFFKRVNDTFGHSKGDEILVQLGQIVRECIRNDDIFIRWGGEEFIIIMPDCSLSDARVASERLRNVVEKHDTGITPISVSIGVAVYDGVDIYRAITSADIALYSAKRTGRNKVVCFDDLIPAEKEQLSEQLVAKAG